MGIDRRDPSGGTADVVSAHGATSATVSVMRTSLSRFTRLVGLGALAALAIGIIRSMRPQPKPPATGTASWPPLVDEPEPKGRSGPVEFTETDAESEPSPDTASSWVEPIEGSCPTTHPVKANAQSGIFHVPGGMSYDRTHAERCYADPSDAEADGYRQAKR